MPTSRDFLMPDRQVGQLTAVPVLDFNQQVWFEVANV
jgi:hypothetical protein